MRNLKLINQTEFEDLVLDGATCFSVDVDKKVVYFLTDSSLYMLSLDRNKLQLCTNLLKADVLNKDSRGTLDGLEYLFTDQKICIYSSTGEVIFFNPITTEVECAGKIEHGIIAMCWSPDQEIVLLINARNTLILMSSDLEPIFEGSLLLDDYGENKPVTVGWGSEQTQFHGSQAKTVNILTEDEDQITKLNRTIEQFNAKVCVSWRGDGQLFATSTPTASGCRQFRIWNREGILQHTAEPLNGLQPTLSWQPSGNLLASTLNRPHRQEIIFFEKNGLRHGEFILPVEAHLTKANLNGEYILLVRELMWNADSSLLAIWLEGIESDNSQKHSLFQIWTCNNDHWYMKQSFRNSSFGFREIIAMHWDQENAYQLHVLYTKGLYLNLNWSWTVSCTMSTTEQDLGIVSVIDGYQVLVTHFRKVVIPPPLSAISLQLSRAVNHILMAPPSAINSILVITDDNSIFAYIPGVSGGESHSKIEVAGGNGFIPQVSPHYLQGTYELSWEKEFHFPENFLPHHWVWVNAKTIIFVFKYFAVSHLAVVNFDLMKGDCTFIVKNIMPLEGDVILICSSPSEVDVAIEMSDGLLYQCNLGDQLVTPWLKTNGVHFKLPHPCYQMNIVCLNSQNHILALSNRFCLYFDDIEIANNCTSFHCVDNCILFTTHDHVLHCISNQVLQRETAEIRAVTTMTEQIRNVERGSVIVTAIPKDTKVILQMPRGNLETIHPRARVLYLTWMHLNNFQYKDALLLMRKHRINMNLIFDHNPDEFLKNVDTFVNQVNDINLINLFLSSLVEEDMKCTLYKQAYASLEYCNERLSNCPPNKVDLICSVMLTAMEKLDANKFFLSSLTAHVKKSTPELEIALQKIKSLKDRKSEAGITIDLALKHLLYLVDVNELYKIALGTYDFELVVLVAEKSQKDPKEYLPFLNELQKLEPNYMKYTIDKHLKKFTSALHHIGECGDARFEECLEFLKSHNLYAEALNVFPKCSNHYMTILEVYGHYLLAKELYDEAGIIFMKGGRFLEALKAFQKSGNWMQAFCAASRMKFSPAETVPLARQFAGILKNKNQYRDAAFVLEIYAQDPEESIVALIEGRDWDRSLLMMHKYGRLDIAESHLLPALIDNFSNLKATLDMLKAKFEQHKTRLSVVRHEIDLNRSNLQANAEDSCLPDSDFFSDTSTVTGFTRSTFSGRSGSRFTSRTSRNKRKQDRKKVTLKEGSLFEDVALMESLTQIINQTDNLKEECGSLIRSLVLHNFDSEAEQLQSQLDLLIKYMIKSKNDIWPAHGEWEMENRAQVGPMSTTNQNCVAVTQGFASISRDIPVEYHTYLHPPALKHITNWKMDILKS